MLSMVSLPRSAIAVSTSPSRAQPRSSASEANERTRRFAITIRAPSCASSHDTPGSACAEHVEPGRDRHALPDDANAVLSEQLVPRDDRERPGFCLGDQQTIEGISVMLRKPLDGGDGGEIERQEIEPV